MRCTTEERQKLSALAAAVDEPEAEVARRILAMFMDGGPDEAKRRLKRAVWGDIAADPALMAKYLAAPLEAYVRDQLTRVEHRRETG